MAINILRYRHIIIFIAFSLFVSCYSNKIDEHEEEYPCIKTMDDSACSFKFITVASVQEDSVSLGRIRDSCIRKNLHEHDYYSFSIDYPKIITRKDTLCLIEEFLSFKNDNRIHNSLVTNFTRTPKPNESFIGYGTSNGMDYVNSLQVWAIYSLCNFLFPSYYQDTAPILINTDNSETSTFESETVDRAWDLVEQWYVNVKKIGLNKVLSNVVVPIPDTSVVTFWRN